VKSYVEVLNPRLYVSREPHIEVNAPQLLYPSSSDPLSSQCVQLLEYGALRVEHEHHVGVCQLQVVKSPECGHMWSALDGFALSPLATVLLDYQVWAPWPLPL
jgi:hypothetical protein